MNKVLNHKNLLNFAQSKFALYISLIWGICEATFFFIVPDVFFMLIALFSPKRGVICAMISIPGSMMGGFIMYYLSLINPEVTTSFLSSIPLISNSLVIYVQETLNNKGLTSMFMAPIKGIPYKIYAVQAANLGIDFLNFMLITIPVRMGRVLLLALICGGIGKFFRKSINSRAHIWFISYFIVWIIYYIFYAVKMTHSY